MDRYIFKNLILSCDEKNTLYFCYKMNRYAYLLNIGIGTQNHPYYQDYDIWRYNLFYPHINKLTNTHSWKPHFYVGIVVYRIVL